MIDLSKWKIGYEYRFEPEIEPLNISEHDYKELGKEFIGEHFISVSDKRNHTLAFILTGTIGDHWIYKLVWKG